MIQANSDIAWVKGGNGRLTPFDELTLAQSIHRVADQAGHADWWLAESIAAAIHVYAVKCHSGGVIPSDEISEIIIAVLSTLGFAEIAAAYARAHRSAEIHLDDLAARLGGAFELEFFRQLDHALHAAADHRLSVLEVDGLRSCVMRLRGAQRWSESCRRLAEEIVDYVRTRVARVRPPQAVGLKLAVLD